ncbi:MAG: DnaA/Hda family protein [Pseudomonadota bacterium]
MITAQLPLELDANRSQRFENFWSGANGTAVAALHALAHEPAGRWLELSGPGDAGKSHLLRATARACQGAVVLPGASLAESVAPEELVEFATAPLLCIDDVDSLFGPQAWEQGLFRLLVALQQSRSGLVVASRTGLRNCRPALPDLASRLTWGESHRVAALDDEDKAALLRARSTEIGLKLDSRTLDYMLSRLPRSTGELLAWLDRIAAASLAAHRRVTVPLVRSLISEQVPSAG